MSAPINGFEDWMRNIERRLLNQERRVQITTAADLLGPGVGPNATEVSDWNNDVIDFNGFFFSQPGALNSPDTDHWWMGYSLADPDGVGFQRITIYRDPASAGLANPFPAWPGPTMTRSFYVTEGSTRSYSDWVGEVPIYLARQAGDVTVVDTNWVPLPNLHVDVAVTSPLEVYLVTCIFDVEHADTGPQTAYGRLLVDGVPQPQLMRFGASAVNGLRSTLPMTWAATGLTPGVRTFGAEARLSGTGAYIYHDLNSTMSVIRSG